MTSCGLRMALIPRVAGRAVHKKKKKRKVLFSSPASTQSGSRSLLLPPALLHPVHQIPGLRCISAPAGIAWGPVARPGISQSGSSNEYGWFQEKPGSGAVTVIHSDTNRPSNIPSQFSSSPSGSTHELTITGVQAEDKAVYYRGD